MKLPETRKVSLFDLILLLLVVLNLLPQTYAVSRLSWFGTAANLFQILCYLALVYLILEKHLPAVQLIAVAAVAAVLLVGYLKSRQAAYFRGLLLLVAAKDVPYKRIIRTCKTAFSGTFCLTVLLWLVGISDSGVGRRGKIALGYVHPNIAAQIVVILVLLWLAEKGTQVRHRHYLLVELAAGLLLWITGSKTAVIVLVLVPLLVEVCRFLTRHPRHTGVLRGLVMASQLLVMAFTYLSARLLPRSGLLQQLDLFFTNRIFLNYYLLDKFGLSLLGSNVLPYFSGTAYNIIRHTNAAITCDNTYALSLMVLGVIPTLLVAGGYVAVIRKALRNRDFMVLATALALTAYAFCECQLTEIYNYFIYFYLFAAAKRTENAS